MKCFHVLQIVLNYFRVVNVLCQIVEAHPKRLLIMSVDYGCVFRKSIEDVDFFPWFFDLLVLMDRAAYKGFADTIRLLLFRDASQGRQDKDGMPS